ncbi:MAG: 50S ribosomal protein L4 [bacterium]
MEVNLYNYKGKEVRKTELPAEIFEQPVNKGFLHEVVTAYQAGIRAGTASTKKRPEVSGGGKKPWRQKGTGRARAGSIRSPLWRKGGIIFGPKPRSYAQYIPKKKVQAALYQALSDKMSSGDLTVVDTLNIFSSGDTPKTKKVINMLKDLHVLGKNLLVITDSVNDAYMRASRNVPFHNLIDLKFLHAYAVLARDKIIITESAVKLLTDRLKRKAKNYGLL